jgi:hypothetical protein
VVVAAVAAPKQPSMNCLNGRVATLSEKPYQAYEGARISGFSPMQLQSQQDAANMQTSGATGAGIGIAGQAAMQGLNQNYQGGQFSGGQFGGRQAAQYMSPFIQEALAPQLREAQRASDIMGQQNAAKAVGQGAFGGSRSALVEAERQRNLGIQQGDILSKGYQTAYEQAANQFNQDMSRGLTAQQLGEQSRQFGANLGLQGLNTALQGAGQLGTLGGQQFQQGMDCRTPTVVNSKPCASKVWTWRTKTSSTSRTTHTSSWASCPT